jgi:hypothetical protein
MTRLLSFLGFVLLCSQASAFEVNLDKDSRYAELAIGSVQLNAPDNFLIPHDSYDNTTGFNLTAGIHLSSTPATANTNADRGQHYVAAEAGFHYFGESESNVIVNGVPSSSAIELTGLAAGLKVARALDEEVHLYTRFGALFWNAEGKASQGGISNGDCCSDDGLDPYIGIGVSYRVYNFGVIKGDFLAVPIELEGRDINLKTFTLGLGYYF